MTNTENGETGNAQSRPRMQPDPQDNPLLAELRRQLSDPGSWSSRFHRLAQAVAEVDDPESHPMDLTCDECDDLLDIYVAEELAGHDVQHGYPLIWRHLEGCERCNQAYRVLWDTLSLERSGQLLVIPQLTTPRLPLFAPPSGNTPWVVRLRSRIGGALLGVVFSFNISYLHTLLAPPALATVRADDFLHPPASRLLLSDTVTVGEQNLVVEVTATQSPEEPEQLYLQAVISASPQLSEKLWARLTWADETRSAPVDAYGHVEFGAVPMAGLQEAVESGQGSFEIAFDVKKRPGPKASSEA